MLRHLAYLGMLTTEQVRYLCFSSSGRTRKRLRLLWQHRLIARHRRPVRMGDGTAPYLYTLTRKGEGVVDANAEKVQSTRYAGKLSLHFEKINDFHIAMMLATKHPRYPTLSNWQQGKRVRFSGTVRTERGGMRVPIVPDAFFVLTFGKLDYVYFLEIDRGTTDLRRIRLKFLAYLDLWRSKAASRQLGIRSFRVLYVTTTQRRLTNLLKVLKGLQRNFQRSEVICLTKQGEISIERPGRLFEPTWETIDQTGHHTRVRAFPVLPITLPTAPANPAVRGPDAGAG
ncbi:MAG: replication-relaxation family protein [bacterium]|nr:replication-relaxation family protein [bacterium]